MWVCLPGSAEDKSEESFGGSAQASNSPKCSRFSRMDAAGRAKALPYTDSSLCPSLLHCYVQRFSATVHRARICHDEPGGQLGELNKRTGTFSMNVLKMEAQLAFLWANCYNYKA